MGVNCSESGLKAMSNVVQNDGLAVIHTVDGIWKVKHFNRRRPRTTASSFLAGTLCIESLDSSSRMHR